MSYSADTFVADEIPTTAKWNKLWNNDASFNDGSGIGAGVIGSAALATGVPVQLVTTMFSASSTGTTVIPSDDTIPQNTEGDQYMTQVFTPKSATNRLFIESKLQGALGTAPTDLTAALFQDATVGALAAGHAVVPTAGYMALCMIGHDMLAGTTAATTFKVRAGPGAAATLTFNGSAGVRRYGGVSFSYIRIIEYKV